MDISKLKIENTTYDIKDSVARSIISDLLNSIPTTVDNTNGHDYVEIGGIKWATTNIGANSVTDTGLYFQWGDTQGYTADQVGSGSGQKYFGWADYKYGDGTSSPGVAGMTKYNSTDGKTVLDLEDDAVRANWGGNWRMPTKDEYVALDAAVTTVWTANYQGSGVAGLVCTDKTDSSKVLFFPARGYCFNGVVSYVGSYGYYWSSSLDSSRVQNACNLNFKDSGVNWEDYYYRCRGLLVRGVLDGPATTTTSNYVEKSSTEGLLKNDGTVDTNTYLTQHLDISGKANVSHTHTTADVTDLVLYIEYTNGHEYVDLGLPSGKLWAKYNVNSTTQLGLGDAFQWGATSAYEGTDNYYTGSPTADNTLPLENDTAHVIMGGGWRMPTYLEWNELFGNTTLSISYAYHDGQYWYFVSCYSLTDPSVYITIPLGGTYDSSTHSFYTTYTNKGTYATSLFGASNETMRKEVINVPSSGSGSNVDYFVQLYGSKSDLYYVRGILDVKEEYKTKYVLTSEKGVARGVAPLESDRKINDTYLPDSVKNTLSGYYYDGDLYSINPYHGTSAPTPDISKKITLAQGRIYYDYETRSFFFYDGVLLYGTNGSRGAVGTGTDTNWILTPDRYSTYILTLTADLNASSLVTSYDWNNGNEIRVIFKAAAQHTVTINHNATYCACPDATTLTLTIPAGGFRVVTFIKADGITYAIPNKVS